MHKTFEYRLYPNRTQQRLLFSCLTESRRIYNEMLELVKSHYAQSGNSLGRYALIAVEDLNVQNLVRNPRLAKSIADAGWSSFVSILGNKAEEADCQVVKVLPRFTTQRCSDCGEMVRKTLSVRVHRCDSCGHAEDRDVNAAKNILLAGMQPSERKVTDCGELAPRSRLL